MGKFDGPLPKNMASKKPCPKCKGPMTVIKIGTQVRWTCKATAACGHTERTRLSE